jgi:hypothetical protein
VTVGGVGVPLSQAREVKDAKYLVPEDVWVDIRQRDGAVRRKLPQQRQQPFAVARPQIAQHIARDALKHVEYLRHVAR